MFFFFFMEGNVTILIRIYIWMNVVFSDVVDVIFVLYVMLHSTHEVVLPVFLLSKSFFLFFLSSFLLIQARIKGGHGRGGAFLLLASVLSSSESIYLCLIGWVCACSVRGHIIVSLNNKLSLILLTNSSWVG